MKKLFLLAALVVGPAQTPSPPAPPLPAGTAITRAAYEALVRLHPAYPPTHFSEAQLAALPAAYPDHTPGEMTYDEPATGYRDEIGIRAKASQVWAITFDPRARANMLANADASKWFPIHQTVDGDIPKPWLVRSWGPLVADPVGNPAISVDVSHEPGFLFDALMLMGLEGNKAKFAEYLREMKFWVSYNFQRFPENARQREKGLFNAVQQRGRAWAFRNLVQLYFVLMKFAPDDEWYPWCKLSISENIKFRDGFYHTGTYVTKPAFAPYYDKELGAFRNDWGITDGANLGYGKGDDGLTAVFAPWQQGFETSVILWSLLLDLDLDPDVKALHRSLAHWMAKFVVMLFGKPDDPASFDYRHAGNYVQPIGKFRASNGELATADVPQAITYFDSPKAFHDANQALNKYPPLPPDDRQLRDGAVIDVAFATRYADSMIPALTMAVEIGADGAAEAFARFKASNQFMTGGSIPFAYLPRGETYGVRGGTSAPAPVPVRTPVASTPPSIASAPIDPSDPPDPLVVGIDDGTPFTLTTSRVLKYGIRLDSEVIANGVAFAAGDHFVYRTLPAGRYTGYLAHQPGFLDPASGLGKRIMYAPDGVAPSPAPVAPTSTRSPEPARSRR